MRAAAAFSLALILVSQAHADPLPPDQVPDPLKPWTRWSLRGHENAACPFFQGTSPEEADSADGGSPQEAPVAPQCLWPARLTLTLEGRGGHFSQDWHVARDAWVPLPGDKAHWPQNVKIDGKAAATLAREEVPSVRLSAGNHTVSGDFIWEQLPESLHVPPATGLLDLTLQERVVPSPSRDASGLLWLQREEGEKKEESRLDITVYREVTDAVPLLVTTRIKLEVSGKSREVVLGKALLDGFAPLSVKSDLPARIENDGRVRAQVRPGTWNIDVVERHDDPVSALKLPSPDGPWAKEELWVFDAHPDLRVVDVEGVPSVDPSQTTLPQEWRQMPTYRVTPGDTMKFVERRRGDAQPAPDQLTLSRRLWLDFAGTGYTARDRITGTLSKGWRLNMAPPAELGRVAIDGQPQLVTRLSASGPAGVEVRNGNVNLEADSRLEGKASDIPATGWEADFSSVSATLELPPGWRLLNASGVDDVPGTWLRQWSLLDLFLVLIIAAAVMRLYGMVWGSLALVGLGLAFTEAGVPQWTWLFPLAFEALVRVLPGGKLSSLMQFGRMVSWVVLTLILIIFATGHIRSGLYPVLERPDESGAFFGARTDALAGIVAASPSSEDEGFAGKKEARGLRSWSSPSGYEQQLDYHQIEPTSVVQTGPGVPAWTWRSYALRWSGPVERAQELHLILLSPTVNMVLAFLRILLLAALCLRLLGRNVRQQLAPIAPAVTMFLVIAIGGANARAAEFPSDDMLEDLQSRLLEPPECAPNCASSPRLLLEAMPDSLTLRMEVSASAHTAVPLPGGLTHWTPDRVTLDGQPAHALRRNDDGALWIELTPGLHQVVLAGALPNRESIQIPLPLKPYRVESKVDGWTLDGVQESGTPDASLQLTRAQHEGGGGGHTLEPGTLPPFVRVERALLLGLDWQVQTKVTRVSPEGTPILLSIPLVSSESVTTADIHVEGGKALINMGPHTSEVVWRSVLKSANAIALEAPKEAAWTEVWRLEASPVWHVEVTGIPPVHRDPKAPRIPEWRPWPGETVSVAITHPAAVSGQTLTIENTELDVTPGIRSADAHLVLSLSSSRGGQHVVTLPEGASLQSLSVDGKSLPVQQEGRKVIIPLHPGTQSADLVWRENGGIGFKYQTASVDLGQASVNATTTIKLSSNRWVLLTFGPPMGPAVLFWGLLVVLFLVAIGLGRVRLTPLRTHHWILLVLGLTQVPVVMAAFVPAWLVLLGWRKEHVAETKPAWRFDLLQLFLAGMTLMALGVLFASIHEGLLGIPDMQVEGNHSTADSLTWFQDRTGTTLPMPVVVSLPLMVYRVLMLLWALWLAFALIRWLRWAWDAFTAGGYWRQPYVPKPRPQWRPPPPPAAPPVPPPSTA